MLLTTIALATSLATSGVATHRPATNRPATHRATHAVSHPTMTMHPCVAIELHSMTEEEKRLFPGRERFDKIEWYESCFKCAHTLLAPEHVDEWKNGGIDMA